MLIGFNNGPCILSMRSKNMSNSGMKSKYLAASKRFRTSINFFNSSVPSILIGVIGINSGYFRQHTYVFYLHFACLPFFTENLQEFFNVNLIRISMSLFSSTEFLTRI